MKPTIQLIMCDAYLAGIYGRKFEESGYKVRIVESPDEALRTAGRVKPRAILYDIHCTPDVAQTLGTLRASPILTQSKIVLVGNVSDWERVQGLAKLADGYLIFGQFVPREAVAKINHLLSL